ncbi:CRISPR-associated ring nuclease Csm6 [Caldovatus aquaticus]|uniref:TIGR02584 family CRISPR-associated protein n=1 Tax=Caldovatus aquaticus TaxID=2865671 RepID=A0ABS7F211_9PROT|nr:CRISPR-associated ring nuclease Csm6 [Caldovatus aquaticus]MBW8269017.1 TIGR02584 family CRISPR-associated protein [Caldovatus aquaticus]
MPPETAPPRWRLLAITGLSPQVVTETLWALAGRAPPELPEAITVLTTAEGAEVAQRLLPPAVAALAAQLGRPLPAPEIRLMRDRAGRPLRDIASAEDNRAAADAIIAEVRALTVDPERALHLSIAGGRKTMSCLAGIALSLFGRAQDRLSHVLVDPALQGREDFFFPPEPPRPGAAGPPPAGLILAEIPFVRLRGRWRPEAIGAGFAELVAAAQAALAPPALEIRPRRREALLGGVPIALPPALLGVLLWLAERARDGAGAVACHGGDAVRRRLAAECLACIARCAGGAATRSAEAARRALAHGMEKEFLAEKVSRLNRALREALGPEAAPYEIRREGRRPFTAYRLALAPEAIAIREEEA